MNRRDFLKIGGATILGAGLAGLGLKHIVEDGVSSSGNPSAHELPNVILIIMDTVRAQSMSAYGYGQPTTPVFEKLAKNGVMFSRAIAPAPWTLPSHGTIFTGQPGLKLNVDFATPLDGTYPTLAEKFQRAGYVTAGFSANRIYVTYEWGLSRGFVHFEDFDTSFGQMMMSTAATKYWIDYGKLVRPLHEKYNLFSKNASELSRDFISWVNFRGTDRPFFAFLNFFDSHEPYYAPMEYARRFANGKPRAYIPKEVYETFDPKIISELSGTYDASIAFVDNEIGKIIDYLTEVDQLEKSIVIITSDHGEQFGEHGFFDHGNSAYLPLVHVPLLLLYPEHVPEGKVIDRTVSLEELAATMLDLTGLQQLDGLPGKSLSRFWLSNPSEEMVRVQSQIAIVKSGIDQGFGPIKSLFFSDYHYIKNPDGSEELYNFQQDPQEDINIANTIEGKGILKQFRAFL